MKTVAEQTEREALKLRALACQLTQATSVHGRQLKGGALIWGRRFGARAYALARALSSEPRGQVFFFLSSSA